MKNNKKGDKYDLILDAAIRVFAKKGFYQSRVTDVAKEAGVADGTIYLYFKNKDDLLISIFEEKIREAIEIFKRELREITGAKEKFAKFIEIHLSLFQANPDLAAVLQVELRQSSRFMKQYKKEELKRFLDLIGEIIEQGQDEGVFRRDIPVGLAKRFVFGALDEIISTWVTAGFKYDLRSYVQPVCRLFMNGFAGKEESIVKDTKIGGVSHEIAG